MADFFEAVTYLLNNEGGLEQNSNDSGGVTNYGISLRFLQSLSNSKKYLVFSEKINGEDIKNLTIEQAKSIYYGEFWLHAPFEKIINQDLCNYIFDMAVNMGISPAIKCLQRACWAVMHDMYILVDDGILGEKTLHIVNDFLGKFPELLSALRAERARYYRAIVASRPEQKIFLKGWLARTYRK